MRLSGLRVLVGVDEQPRWGEHPLNFVLEAGPVISRHVVKHIAGGDDVEAVARPAREEPQRVVEHDLEPAVGQLSPQALARGGEDSLVHFANERAGDPPEVVLVA